MIIENVFIPDDEKNILRKLIGKKIEKISAWEETDFEYDFVWLLYIHSEDLDVQIEREDIVAKFENIIEDGGLFKISEPSDIEKCQSEKTINRVVKNVSIIVDSFEFEKDRYKITYPKAIMIHFDDCRLLIGKRWLSRRNSCRLLNSCKKKILDLVQIKDLSLFPPDMYRKNFQAGFDSII